MHPNITSIERQLQFVEYYHAGLTILEIAKKLKASEKIISKYLKLHGAKNIIRLERSRYPRNGKSDIDYFNENYIINEITNCWQWQGNKNVKGYGQFWFDGDTKGAHRFAYLRFNGIIKKGLFVLHKCDNPGCVNPNHLFLGTQKQNMEDKVYKNRHKTGKQSLSTAIKNELVNRRCEGEKISILAKEYNLNYDSLFMFFKRRKLTNIRQG